MQGMENVGISKLPSQVLSAVLKQIEQTQRLRCCAVVSRTWHTAAHMATNSITATGPPTPYGGRVGLNDDKCTALSHWLSTHGAVAALESMVVAGAGSSGAIHTVQLPVPQLATLRRLEARDVKLADAEAAAEEDRTELPLGLSALTHLRLRNCRMELSALPAFMALQHLSLAGHSGDSTISAVLEAIPALQLLTYLELSGQYAVDAVMSGVQHLPNLEQLLLCTDYRSGCTAASFAALPASITKLCIKHSKCPLAQPLLLSADNTPGLTQPTTLQWLDVSDVVFDLALLASLQSLRHVAIEGALAAAPVGVQGVGLAVLSSLTALEHLKLTPHTLPNQPTSADIAALTASSQLTYLDIGSGIARGHYSHMFPAGRQLQQLRGLRATMGIMARTQDTITLARCCPNLQQLELSQGGKQRAARSNIRRNPRKCAVGSHGAVKHDHIVSNLPTTLCICRELLPAPSIVVITQLSYE